MHCSISITVNQDTFNCNLYFIGDETIQARMDKWALGEGIKQTINCFCNSRYVHYMTLFHTNIDKTFKNVFKNLPLLHISDYKIRHFNIS